MDIINDDSEEEKGKGGSRSHRRKSSAVENDNMKLMMDEDLKLKNEKYMMGEVFHEQEEHGSDAEDDSFEHPRKRKATIEVQDTDQSPMPSPGDRKDTDQSLGAGQDSEQSPNQKQVDLNESDEGMIKLDEASDSGEDNDHHNNDNKSNHSDK